MDKRGSWKTITIVIIIIIIALFLLNKYVFTGSVVGDISEQHCIDVDSIWTGGKCCGDDGQEFYSDPGQGNGCCAYGLPYHSGTNQLAGDVAFLCYDGQWYNHGQIISVDFIENKEECNIVGEFFALDSYGWSEGNGYGIRCGEEMACDGNGNCVDEASLELEIPGLGPIHLPGLNCRYLYWVDNVNQFCSYGEFCGYFMYLGLRVFETFDECWGASPNQCSDGIDNDADGLIDMADDYCESPEDPSEFSDTDNGDNPEQRGCLTFWWKGYANQPETSCDYCTLAEDSYILHEYDIYGKSGMPIEKIYSCDYCENGVGENCVLET